MTQDWPENGIYTLYWCRYSPSKKSQRYALPGSPKQWNLNSEVVQKYLKDYHSEDQLALYVADDIAILYWSSKRDAEVAGVGHNAAMPPKSALPADQSGLEDVDEFDESEGYIDRMVELSNILPDKGAVTLVTMQNLVLRAGVIDPQDDKPSDIAAMTQVHYDNDSDIDEDITISDIVLITEDQSLEDVDEFAADCGYCDATARVNVPGIDMQELHRAHMSAEQYVYDNVDFSARVARYQTFLQKMREAGFELETHDSEDGSGYETWRPAKAVTESLEDEDEFFPTELTPTTTHVWYNPKSIELGPDHVIEIAKMILIDAGYTVGNFTLRDRYDYVGGRRLSGLLEIDSTLWEDMVEKGGQITFNEHGIEVTIENEDTILRNRGIDA